MKEKKLKSLEYYKGLKKKRRERRERINMFNWAKKLYERIHGKFIVGEN